ncbi:GspE/PulE family protein [Caproiciproducens faecalis]|uniref:Flp pilus assembly complex ATPase component TadA n=1 Tax=Caproiciproducens faecalis TaxID=2820301 RepID=A0ABS7DL34_9FIRM|nr:ATPase, T2SS/T4P/T4SS family [Caproiciproducens faecalis]MBW7571550.1 Flp pilus assembly complex ATPase component TadA [Caproiciproducens faecalis]
MKITNLKLGQILINSGVLTEEQLQLALERQKGTNVRLGKILIDNRFLTEMQIIRSLEKQLSIPYLDLSSVSVDPSLSSLVPEDLARSNLIVPISRSGSILTVAVADPLDYNGINDIGIYTKLKVNPVIAEREKLETKIRELYTTQKAFAAARELSVAQPDIPLDQMEGQSGTDQPIIRFVNNMIEQAVLLKASDIHIEPEEKSMRIRFRVDGRLSLYMETSAELIPSVVSRIKFIGGMNIAEKRIPQDGRINYRIGGKDIDMRISILPCVFGEKVVIRITTALSFSLVKEEIGFLPENLEKFNALLRNNHGIILLTGPTGSGKSTTLYTALKEIMREDINIVTVENPVEMIIPNITQVDINAKAGLTFAAVLRSILRQDPDVVMIGEIRDTETAEIASSVAITGHLVLSTLHTYDAPSSIIRLIDMGVEPYMVSSSVLGVIAQRLVRTLCPHCKEEYLADDSELELLGKPKGTQLKLYRAKGCSYCSGKGYRGRTAIHEIMPVSSGIKACINSGKSTDQIRETAVKEGMVTLDDNIKRIVIEGRTSVQEMMEVYSLQM